MLKKQVLMKTIFLNSIDQYNQQNNNPTLHPQVSIIDFSKAKARQGGFRLEMGLYCILLKDVTGCEIKYGKNKYDYQEESLIFLAPEQVFEVEKTAIPYQPKGFSLAFHPDFIRGTSLGRKISSYQFFGYNVNEALHLSSQERTLVLDFFAKIQAELQQTTDKHSKQLIISNIELFLNYCERFYDRQFSTRENLNQHILMRFDELLEHYFSSQKMTIELPSVAFCADKLHLSANYFGDLIRKKTGKSAQEYIQHKIIKIAQQQLLNSEKTIGEISDYLGFKHISSFTRLFKKMVGISPNEFRKKK